jgi:cytochrome b
MACVILLTVLGLGILYDDGLDIGADGTLLLKTFHVYIGYVFVINLLWRLIWAFVGNAHARWSSILPFQSGFGIELKCYLRGLMSGTPANYLGHDPLGRLMVTLLLSLLITQAASGLVLAGTDLYKPPLGGIMANWVTDGDADKLVSLKPGSKEFVNPASYEEMRAFRKPFRNTHHYLFYVLLIAVGLHIAGVVATEIRNRNGLISAMLTGDKVFSSTPVDIDVEHTKSNIKRRDSTRES